MRPANRAAKLDEKKMMTRCPLPARLAMVIAFATLLALPACAASAEPQAALRIRVGEKAPAFTLPSASGKPVSLAQFAGRNVLLDFYEGYW